MRFKRPIYRILFFAGWLVLIGGLVTLLIAANQRNKEHVCKGIEVTINNGGEKIFVEKEDVVKSIEQKSGSSLLKKHFGEINLNALEKTLETNPWIRDAELYFDTKDFLHVSVIERLPVARVFTTAGASFYLDSAGYQMPLLQKYKVRLPVVTGFAMIKKRSSRDSALITNLLKVVEAINADAFWKAQIGQIDVLANSQLELIPTLGDGIIKIGDGTAIEEKLERLMIFYRQVLPKAGFTKYAAFDLRFDGQVVAVKKGPQSPVDSIQLQKNIQELMRKKAAEQEAEGIEPEENMQMPKHPSIELYTDSTVTVTAKTLPSVADKNTSASNPAKSSDQKIGAKPVVTKSNMVKPKIPVKKDQKPKAVMPGRNEY